MHAHDEDVVDENTQKRRDEESRNDEHEAREHGKGEVFSGAPQPSLQGAEDRLATAPGRKPGVRFDAEDHAGKTVIELLPTHLARAAGRVVQINHPVAITLHNDKVVELPEDNNRHGQGEDGGRFPAVSLGLQTVCTRRLDDVARLAAVATDAAGDAQLLDGDIAAIITQDDCQGGGAALDGFHLQNGWRVHALDVGSRRKRCVRGLPVHSTPKSFLRKGMTRVMGRRSRTRTLQLTMVPTWMSVRGPSEEVHL